MDREVTLPDGPEGASFARRAMARAADLWRLDREMTEHRAAAGQRARHERDPARHPTRPVVAAAGPGSVAGRGDRQLFRAARS